MRRGEITGQILNVTKADIGMPMRSMTNMAKKEERKQRTNMDDVINVDTNNPQQIDHNFKYFDPSTTQFSNETGSDNILGDISSPPTHQQLNQHLSSLIVDRFSDGDIQNIAQFNTEYINSMSINIFNSIAKNTYVNFCVFPIGVLATIIANDPNINQVMSFINTSEIFHQIKIVDNQNKINSRSSVIMNMTSKYSTNNFLHYEDNENSIVELSFINSKFSIGFICSKHDNNVLLSNKLFSVYVSNLKHTKTNVYCPSFGVSNNLNLTKILSSSGYLPNNNAKYTQTIFLKLMNNILIKTSNMQSHIDLSDSFLFYIRYVPNNIILYLGRYGF
jgi:hypothetical protein